VAVAHKNVVTVRAEFADEQLLHDLYESRKSRSSNRPAGANALFKLQQERDE
jgi:hypothetical protein